MENKFEKASRLRIRFQSSRGNLTVEDLWTLPLTSTGRPNLDDVAKEAYLVLKDTETGSFVSPTTRGNEVAQLKFDIVKHIIDVRLAENALAAEAKANKERKARVLEIIAKKDDEELLGKSRDELIKLAESM